MKPCKYGHTDGRYPSGGCKACGRARNKANKAAVKAATLRWQAANPEKVRAARRAYRKANPEKTKAARRRHALAVYGLTVEQFDKLSEEQDHRCAICRRQVTPLAVDHCHSTGKVRGLLCSSCNNGLGRFSDSPESLRRAAEYLEKHL